MPCSGPADFSEVWTLNHQKRKAAGYLSFTLHAHLPYVVNHGTWPHGMEWLLEAAAETYLPLLRVFGNLERDGIALHCNLNISPILLEQLAHPVFKAEFPNYIERKIVAAREDEAFFSSTGEHHLAVIARFWQRFFSETLSHFRSLDGDMIKGFRYFNDRGLIEVITCGATHGYMPLLGTDESVRAQVRTAVNAHIRHMGKHPRGIWAPECGYRPAGFWNFPVGNADGSATQPGYDRVGVEQVLSESDISYFFVDTHLIEESAGVQSPYRLPDEAGPSSAPARGVEERSLYQPYLVDGPYLAEGRREAATVFARDPRTGMQVWSGDYGYPGDSRYLDFHKKRWPGGHRYWRVTGADVDMADKQFYYPNEAEERIEAHANHFVALVRKTLQASLNDARPPILCSPFDAELFGHWWFEGPQWLEAVARKLHDEPDGIELIQCAEYLDRFPGSEFIKMHEGSWGAEGTNHVWLNPDTSWTYTHIYPAELFTREVCTEGTWRNSAQSERIVKQLCRELLLLESSDWQFLITTGAARDYAELRFHTHNDQFNELKNMWQSQAADGRISQEQEERLAAIEHRDSIFPDIDPGFWAVGAHQTREDAFPSSQPS